MQLQSDDPTFFTMKGTECGGVSKVPFFSIIILLEKMRGHS